MEDKAEYIPEFNYEYILKVIDEADKRHFEWLYYKRLIELMHPELLYQWKEKKN